MDRNVSNENLNAGWVLRGGSKQERQRVLDLLKKKLKEKDDYEARRRAERKFEEAAEKLLRDKNEE